MRKFLKIAAGIVIVWTALLVYIAVKAAPNDEATSDLILPPIKYTEFTGYEPRARVCLPGEDSVKWMTDNGFHQVIWLQTAPNIHMWYRGSDNMIALWDWNVFPNHYCLFAMGELQPEVRVK